MADKKNFFLSENCRLYPSEPSESRLAAQWLVYYYICGERKQRKGNINQFKTVAERIDAAKKIAEGIETELFVLRQNAIANTPFVVELQTAFAKRSKSLRPKSISTYKTKVSAFVKFLCDNVIENPTKKDVTDFFDGLKTTHANTLSVYRVTLFSLVEDMRKAGLVYENIFAHIKIKKREMQPKWFFAAYQVERLKSEMLKTGQKQLWLACQLQHYALLRPAEIRGLLISDLLLEENKILCRAEISKNKKREFIVLPKHITQAIAEVAVHKSDKSFLFSSENGKQLAVNYFYRQFKKVLITLNMDTKKHSFYSWKHTGARAWIKSGGSVYGLMRQMRHHSLDQTQQYLRKLGILEFEDDVNAMPVI